MTENSYEKRDITCDNNRSCGTHLVYTPPRFHCGGYAPYFLYPFAYTHGCYHNHHYHGCGCDFSIEHEKPITSSNKHDNTKENLLVIDGATDLLKITSSVPSSTKKSILTVYRDKTKTDVKEHERVYKELSGRITSLEDKYLKEQGIGLTDETRAKLNIILKELS